MVLVNGIKYACERCIRGHRVTTCNHTDQPLMMIKPKGRPSTTCSHCKELRKNKNANPTGSCTCGRQEKKRLAQKAKEEARASGRGKEDSCSCLDGDKCSCHRTRKTVRRTVSSKNKGTTASSVTSGDSPTMPALDSSDLMGKIGKNHGLSSIPSFHSSQSLDRDFSLAQSPPFSPSLHSSNTNNWDTSSIRSSLLSESELNLMDRGPCFSVQTPQEPNTTGGKHTPSLSKARASDYANSADGFSEVNSNGGLEGFGFHNAMGWPQSEAKHGCMDLFADTSDFGNTDYRTLKQHHSIKSPGNYSSEKAKSPESPRASIVNSRSTSFHRDVPKSFVSRPSIDSASSDFSRFSISGHNAKDRSITSVSENQSAHQPYVAARHLPPQAFLSKENVQPGCFNLEDRNSQSVEVLSLTPSFMDIPDNANLYSATSNPFLNPQNGVEPRQRSVSIHRNHRYDQQTGNTTMSQPSLNSTNHGVKNAKLSPSRSLYESSHNVPIVSTDAPIKESPGSENDVLSAPMGLPDKGVTARQMEPTPSFASDFDDILGYNTNDDTHSLLSGPSLNLDVNGNINPDNLSLNRNTQLSPTLYSEPVGDFSFNDLDKLMADL
ncbi:LAME_0B02850g1_1 [Lachancea meyersii CBS 8951]|uniref:LAME_0B02850g1_1 n=1 Tax=Lachancea meyersii CBS 8951 TaxID=1266667 RepID=A0A1G4ITT4_9SACH|nr:LAME_0B02850g1_1 [Lachancea meyersii CBS 8951]